VAFFFSRKKGRSMDSRDRTAADLHRLDAVHDHPAFYPDDAWEYWDKVWKIQLFVFLTAILINDRKKLDWLIWVMVLSLGFTA
jgi:hypothetical protein